MARALTAALALCLALAGGAAAQQARLSLLFLGGDEAPSMALLTTPEGWVSGDAVAVVAGAPEPNLTTALLAAGAAVVEVREPPPAHPLDAMARALETVRGTLGSRLVVAIGLEGWGATALEAGQLGFAAAVAFEAGVATVRPGAEPPEHERWDLRAPMFCAALAEADARWGRSCEAVYGPVRLARAR